MTGNGGLVAINEFISIAQSPLVETTPVRVTLVRGRDYAILIDTGTNSMSAQIMSLLESKSTLPMDVRLIANTHGHHDHIGGNAALKAATGAMVAAPSASVPWIEDHEAHFRAFCMVAPEVLPEEDWMRDECFAPLGPDSQVEICIGAGDTLRPGGTTLEVIDVSGHATAEIAFIETATNTLILGDGLVGNGIVNLGPLFHGYVDAQAYRQTLANVRRLNSNHRFGRVVSAHLPLTDSAGLDEHLHQAEQFFDSVEGAILDLASGGGQGLQSIWIHVCERWGYRLEFRGLAMVKSHIDLLVAEGRMRSTDDSLFITT